MSKPQGESAGKKDLNSGIQLQLWPPLRSSTFLEFSRADGLQTPPGQLWAHFLSTPFFGA